ncbi:MAG: DUF1476 domain-containing protein [Henriciella sp.]
MSIFDEREASQEAKYSLEQKLEFRILARRNKLLGQWAAELLQLPNDDIPDYAFAVARADLEQHGEEDVFQKLRTDFDEANVNCSDSEIRDRMAELISIARAQVLSEKD